MSRAGGTLAKLGFLISSACNPIRLSYLHAFVVEGDRLATEKLDCGEAEAERRPLGCLVGSGKGPHATRPSWLEWQLGPGST